MLALAPALFLTLAAGTGLYLGGAVLHPQRRSFTDADVQNADRMAERNAAGREDLEVTAPDGVKLRGWKFRAGAGNAGDAQPGAAEPTGDWVLLFHGVSDHRGGMLGYAGTLLRRGYHVVTMDARGHGQSEGAMVTYGWKEREDTRAVMDALLAREEVHCLFLLGESMGAAVALQAAAAEPRAAGVVAESAFASLKEVSYDYSGLRISHWLGRTLLRPAAAVALRRAEKEGGFRAEDVSPERAVAARAFPVLLICGIRDRNIPPRHTQKIYRAAIGPKEVWLVPGAPHTGAFGTAPQEFEHRVTDFFARIHAARSE
jgi:hypothetical protein